MNIPPKFNEIIKKNQLLHSIVLEVVSSFEPIFKDNKLFFFEEYTDHGIEHIEKVLEASEFIITNESFENISPNEVAVLILSIILHDLGMHVELSTFKAMLGGEYDSVKIDILDDKTWNELWVDYLNEVKRFSSLQKKAIFGNEAHAFSVPDLSNKDSLTGYDKKLIGEFLRRNHGRLAQEISLIGLKSENGIISFGGNRIDDSTKQLAGIVARSHNMNLRDTFAYLKSIAHESWMNPHNINVVYLMVILRIADYIQIDSNRVNSFLLKMKTFTSPISKLENETHLAINSLNFYNTDSERIYVDCKPLNSEMYVKIKSLILDIQKELDTSWAVLGEIYGFLPIRKPSIKFRRISSTLDDKSYRNTLNYIPEKITFKVDTNLSRLLVDPLYGHKPTFGVRELLQNAIDACMERKEIEFQKGNLQYIPSITISINEIDSLNSTFIIQDNGKGMSSYEIINYFLNVGTSFRKSMDWKKKFVDDEGKVKITRNGKFGIGVLASFLLGDEIQVSTRSISSMENCSFNASIDSEFINISTNNSDEQNGTIITIPITNKKRDELLNHTMSWDNRALKWTNWYIYKEPSIKYFVNGEELKIENNINPKKYFEFKPDKFENIKWSYKDSSVGYGSPHIACNGIVITSEYRPNIFTYESSEDVNPSDYVIYKKPNLLVTDKEGIFPVKLDRNSIDCDIFPFEDELKYETSKHFIAELLNFKIDKDKLSQKSLLHHVKIMWGKNGFVPQIDYFIEVAKLDFQCVRLITENKSIKIDLNEYDNILFHCDFDRRINLTNQAWNVAPAYGRFVLSSSNFNILFGESRRLPLYINRQTQVVEENVNHVLYRIGTDVFSEEGKILTNINSIDENLLSQVGSIQELPGEYFFTGKSGEILYSLFEKYIGKNFIIPYDLDKRMELYPDAFRDLAHFM